MGMHCSYVWYVLVPRFKGDLYDYRLSVAEQSVVYGSIFIYHPTQNTNQLNDPTRPNQLQTENVDQTHQPTFRLYPVPVNKYDNI